MIINYKYIIYIVYKIIIDIKLIAMKDEILAIFAQHRRVLEGQSTAIFSDHIRSQIDYFVENNLPI